MWREIRKWQRGERGVSEVASAIFVLPFIAFFVFALIESGFNMRAHTLVDNITSDTVRSISQDGALYWARTSPSGAVSVDHTWEAVGQEQLQELCTQAASKCTEAPTMDCNVADSPVTSDAGVQIARSAGTEVTCKATFYYDPVSPLSKNPVTSLGLSTFFTHPITSTVSGRTVVGCATNDPTGTGCE